MERYQIFENKGMCFPFAADLSAEVLRSGVANVFTRDAERVFLISSPLSLGDFQWLTYCVWRDWGGCAEEKMRGKLCQYIRVRMRKVNVRVCCGLAPQRGDLGRQGSRCSESHAARPEPPSFSSLQRYGNNKPQSGSDHSATGQRSDT